MPPISRVARALYRALHPVAVLLDAVPALRVGIAAETRSQLRHLVPPPLGEPRASPASAVALLRASFRDSRDEALALRLLPEVNAALERARRTYKFGCENSDRTKTEMLRLETEARAQQHTAASEPAAGRFLIAAASLDGAFERAVVLILEHSSRGSFGVVLSKARDVPLVGAETPQGDSSSIMASHVGKRKMKSPDIFERPYLDWSSASIDIIDKAETTLQRPRGSFRSLHLNRLPASFNGTFNIAQSRFYNRATTLARMSEAEVLLGRLQANGISSVAGTKSSILVKLADQTTALTLLPLGPGLDAAAPAQLREEQDSWDEAAWRANVAAGGIRLPPSVVLMEENGDERGRASPSRKRYLRSRLSLSVGQRRASRGSGRRIFLGPRAVRASYNHRRAFSCPYRWCTASHRSRGELRWLKRLEDHEAFDASMLAAAVSDDDSDSDNGDDDVSVAADAEDNSTFQSFNNDRDDDDAEYSEDENDRDGPDANSDASASIFAAETENIDNTNLHSRRLRRRHLRNSVNSLSTKKVQGIISRRDLQALRSAMSSGGDLTPRMVEAMNAVAEAFFGGGSGTATAWGPDSRRQLSQDESVPSIDLHSDAASVSQDSVAIEPTVIPFYRVYSKRPSTDENAHEEASGSNSDEESTGTVLEDLLQDLDQEQATSDFEKHGDHSSGRHSRSLDQRSKFRRRAREFLLKSFSLSLRFCDDGVVMAPLPHIARENEGALVFVPSLCSDKPSTIRLLGSAAGMRVDQARLAVSAFVSALKQLEHPSGTEHLSKPGLPRHSKLPSRQSGGPVSGFSYAIHSYPDLARSARRRGAAVVTLPCPSKTPVFVTRCDVRSLSGARGCGERAFSFDSAAVWSAGQLEEEVARGHFIISSTHDVWGEIRRVASSADAWSSTLLSLGGEYAAVLAAVPPRQNR
jgi:putative AlgH/UPF0301 family transcriptional regulator